MVNEYFLIYISYIPSTNYFRTFLSLFILLFLTIIIELVDIYNFGISNNTQTKNNLSTSKI